MSDFEALVVPGRFSLAAEWGTLDVTDGVLVPTDFSRATVAAPKDIKGTPSRRIDVD